LTKRSAEKISVIRDMAEVATATEIARAIGVSVSTLISWAEDELITLMTRSQARKKALADPEVRARMSQASKKAWADPEVRARMSQARKKALADPEVRARMSQASKKAWADPEVRARISQASKKALADPEVRARMSQASKKAWADPEVRARIKATRCGAKGILIPKWVPLDLQDEYLEIAATDGEESAASHIRKLKREMEAA
jgi:hypothetical protein